jgi:two-component system invasion response regulator UvrY
LAAGKTVTQIGNELHLSVKTISTHRNHILHKMDMRNNADMVSYAQMKGLVD